MIPTYRAEFFHFRNLDITGLLNYVSIKSLTLRHAEVLCMFIACLKDQYLLPQRNNNSKVLHVRCIRISSIIAEYAFCRVLLSLFHSKIVISNSINTLTLLQNWKRLFVFITLWLLEVSASLTCIIVHVNRHFEPWGPNSVLHV